MPTLIEIPEPEVQEELKGGGGDTCFRGPEPAWDPASLAVSSTAHLLFSDSLLESSSSQRRRRSLATTLSIIFQCMAVGALLIVPLMFTEALPTQQLLTFLV